MEVVYWQLFVVVSVAFAFIIFGRRAAFWVCIAWTAWTLIALFYLPLVMIQLASCWITYLVLRSTANLFASLREERAIRRERDLAIKELKKQVDAFVRSPEATSSQRKAINSLAKAAPEKLSFVSGADHYELLKASFASARESVSILSGWIGSPVMDPDVQVVIRSALERGVTVHIGFGWESSSGHELSSVAQQAYSFLSSLSTKGGGKGLILAKFPNHEKILVCDRSFVVIGSNNWLSNRAFKNSERSLRVDSKHYAAIESERVQTLVRKHRVRGP